MTYRSRNNCPFCLEGKVRTTDSRYAADDNVLIRRRRKCQNCAKSFTTHEVIVNEKGIGQEQYTAEIVRFCDQVEKAARDVFGDKFRVVSQSARSSK